MFADFPLAPGVLAADDGGGLLLGELSAVALLATAALVALLVRRIKIPYTVALVLAGLGFAFFPDFIDLPISSDLILGLLVPPLLFEATLHLSWKKLKKDLPIVLALALIGTLLGTMLVASIVRPFSDLDWATALAFGALISATDPVAVIAFFKSMGVSKRLMVLVEGESLFNDGVAIVIFTLAVKAAISGESPSVGDALGQFILVGFGGLAVGLVLGYISSAILENIDDYLIEATATLAVAYGAYVVAEEFGYIFGIADFHVSGILAVVAAGLVVGNKGLNSTSPTNRRTLEKFWELLSFIVNSLVFLVLGIRIDLTELSPHLGAAAAAIVAVLISRALIIYGIGFIHARIERGEAVPVAFRHVQFWGGLRGAISLALALLIEEPDFSAEVVDTVQVMTFGVVLFTLLIQGTTISGLINRLGLAGEVESELQQQRHQARIYGKRAGRAELERLRQEGILFPDMTSSMTSLYDTEIRAAGDDLASHFRSHPELEVAMLIQARRDALHAEQLAIVDVERRGLVAGEVAQELNEDLDTRAFALDLIEERWEQSPSQQSTSAALPNTAVER